jgi:hypothetical protein
MVASETYQNNSIFLVLLPLFLPARNDCGEGIGAVLLGSPGARPVSRGTDGA